METIGLLFLLFSLKWKDDLWLIFITKSKSKTGHKKKH